jgi:HAE1 family hydrophobic/amphiphilic exporter-1
MMKKIVGRPVLGIVVFGLIAIVALYLLSGVAIDMFPEINMPVLMVSTTYSGAGPETVEKTVTKLLESSLVNIGGISSITSTSSEGQSVITLEFEYGVNLDNKTNDVRDRLDRVKRRLPDEAAAPVIRQVDPSAMPIMRIALRGNRLLSGNPRSRNCLNSICDVVRGFTVNPAACPAPPPGRPPPRPR